MSGEITDVDRHISRKFEVGTKLGKGAYGIVWKATERRSGSVVALKKIFDAFQNATDAQRTYREIIYLKQMSNHENIIRLDDVLRAENDRDIYLVFEFMETDLHTAIRASILEDVHKQYIMYQAFKALMYMHSAQLVHRDMKPANLLLNAECLMKVADFGLARSLLPGAVEGDAPDRTLMCTDYVATRWYRAPEILVASNNYGTPVDLWSLGCIFGEMLAGDPVFTGKTTLNQLEYIIDMLGLPDSEDMDSLNSEYSRTLIDGCQLNVSSAGEKAKAPGGAPSGTVPNGDLPNGDATGDTSGAAPAPSPAETQHYGSQEAVRQRFHEKYGAAPHNATEDATDLLSKLIVLNPHKRIVAEEALSHPYVAAFHDPSTAFKASRSVEDFDLNDSLKATTAVYRDKLYKMMPFKPEVPGTNRGAGGGGTNRPKQSHRSRV